MSKRCWPDLHACVLTALLTGALATPAEAAGLFDKLKQLAGPTGYVVRGRLQTHDEQWVTCFNGIKTGYLGAADMARPGDARINPATGQIQMSTAAIPAIVMTRDGTVTSNDCDSLDAQHMLVLVMPQAPGATAGDGLIRDKYGCGVWTEDEFRVADKDEIMACQARVITEREAARLRPQAVAPDTGYRDAYGTPCVTADMNGDEIVRNTGSLHECQMDAVSERAWNRAQAHSQAAAAGSGAASAGPGEAQRQAAVARLQQDTAAKFAAIQAGAGAAAAAPAAAASAEDLAWDGAKLCGLKPAYMMQLKDEALAFVRIDQAADRIVMAEMAGGARQEIALDGNAFAQRVSFNAQATGQGGDTCGRAFWNAEAYKAATTAMSAP
ncbi:MAG: hypothetical protein IT493_14000 [Gammaproteobacteria bacterium]|nr:hypothetical protein [Gammaproteobacteria bacterium]